ncbi:hypothetical protein ADK76_14005 [Streptomyces griseoflavus]|uniref:hypothetical protein n=1 Tax=Streptomyces rimosus TaxID=1927 RepID=UPI00051846DE|nr:hypothetical protein ADK76_14005 [Streptomyces griseoflavus]
MTVRRDHRALRIAAAVELVSLVVLLGNLATAHLPAISSLAGPLHGCAYLFTVVATARDPRRTATAVGLSMLPGVGGMLAVRRLTRGAERGDPVPVRE